MTAFESPANMSFIQGPFGAGVQVLATRTGAPAPSPESKVPYFAGSRVTRRTRGFPEASSRL